MVVTCPSLGALGCGAGEQEVKTGRCFLALACLLPPPTLAPRLALSHPLPTPHPSLPSSHPAASPISLPGQEVELCGEEVSGAPFPLGLDAEQGPDCGAS